MAKRPEAGVSVEEDEEDPRSPRGEATGGPKIIFYALVSLGKKVLASCASPVIQPSAIEIQQDTLHCQELAQKILVKITSGGRLTNHRKTLASKEYAFHYQVEDGFIFLCITPRDYLQRLAFGFLRDIIIIFQHKYENQDFLDASPYELNNDFGRVLRQKLAYYSDQGTEVMTEVQQKMNKVKTAMLKNVDRVMERQGRIDVLKTKTQTLKDAGIGFRQTAVEAKQKACWTNFKSTFCLITVIVIVILVFIYFLGYIFCGGITWPDCRHTQSTL
jgi:vesicle-associated membrane protein 7